MSLLQAARTIATAAPDLAQHGDAGIAIGALVLALVVVGGGGVILNRLVSKLIASIPSKERVDDALEAVPVLTTEIVSIKSKQTELAASMVRLADAQVDMSSALKVALDRGSSNTLASTG